MFFREPVESVASAASGLLEPNLALGEEDGGRREGARERGSAQSFVELFLIPQVGSMASSQPLLSNLAVKCTADEAGEKGKGGNFLYRQSAGCSDL